MLRTLWLFWSSMALALSRRARRGPEHPTWDLMTEIIFILMRRDWQGLEQLPLADLRKALLKKPVPQAAVRKTRRTRDTLGNVPATWFEPTIMSSDAVILYLHGGSYIFGSTQTHADVMARFALATGCRVVGIDYRLAPEHPFPAQLEDAQAAFQALVERGHPVERIVLAGESAGGNLVVALQLALRDAGKPQAALGIAISPWLDLASSSPSCTANDASDYGSRAMLLQQAKMFSGEVSVEDPRISVIHADPRGLAPLYLQVGRIERLHDEVIGFAEKARTAGVEVTLDVQPDMPHAPVLLAAWVKEGRRSIERAAQWMVARLGQTSPTMDSTANVRAR